jgi:hypothetical protein
MSQRPPEGWWQASDGNWYPPEQRPGKVVPVQTPAGTRPGQPQTERFTSLPPEHALGVLLQALAGGGAQITAQSPTVIVGNVITKNQPSCIVASVLFLIFIIPAIIYLMTAGRDVVEPFSISLRAQDNGTWVSGSGRGRGLAAVKYAIEQLPA